MRLLPTPSALLFFCVLPACSSGAKKPEAVAPASLGSAGALAPAAALLSSASDVPARVWEPDQALAPIFASDDFRRRFAESFLAETDIEPSLIGTEGEDLTRVIELVGSERLPEAIQLLSSKRTPASSAMVDFMLANLYFSSEDLDPAVECYRLAVKKFPKFLRAWKNLAQLLVRQSRFEEAELAFTRVLELGGVDGLQYGLLGFCHEKNQAYFAAESAYRQAHLLDPETLEWRMGLARCFFRQQRFADAQAMCAALLAENPDNADLWLLQANAWIGLEQPLRAAENYEIVERLGKSTADSLNTLGDIYLNEELYGLAADCYVRALERDEQPRVERCVRAARVLIARGALEETRTVLARIEALGDATLDEVQRKDVLKLHARLAVAEGQGGEEVRVLERIIALDPLDGEALLLLGQHHRVAGDKERAIFCFEQAAALEAFEADAKVRHAQILVEDRRYAEALPLLRRAQTLKPRAHVQDFLEDVERQAQKNR